MKARDYSRLLAELGQEYADLTPQSAALNEKARQYMVDGGNHSLRLVRPFPPRIASAHGAWLRDEDGRQLLDFWQGHFADILGHNPPVITSALAEALESGFGLQTGFTDRLQVETAEIFCRQTGAERVRFTTSGTLATMYAIMLSRALTNRTLVMKVGGGWHGAQPWALKGIGYDRRPERGFERLESEGVPVAVTDQVIISGFNEPERLREQFAQIGDQLACFIVEPFLGVGGFVPATREYLQTARELTQKHGTILILDEVIAGFRFHAGNCSALYGVQPDLATFGKVMGGGMPVAAVGGRADILELAGRATGSRVRFSGGTYSAHPASLLAAKMMMNYLMTHQAEIYPRLAELGARTRQMAAKAFLDEGIYVHVTGHDPSALPGSSMFMLHFPFDETTPMRVPRDWLNPNTCDLTLAHEVLDLALLVEGVFMLHSHGALSTVHTPADIDRLDEAWRRVARRVKPYL